MKAAEILIERYVNLLPSDAEEKARYAPEVWDLLVSSYAPVGGLKGKGFSSIEDMIETIPFWKLVRRNGRIVAVKLYRDKNGRKSVASATDGTQEGKAELAKIMQDDARLSRSYSEISPNVYRFALKALGQELLDAAIIPAEVAKEIDGSVMLIPGEPYWYEREIGDSGEVKRKIMLGHVGVPLHDRGATSA